MNARPVGVKVRESSCRYVRNTAVHSFVLLPAIVVLSYYFRSTCLYMMLQRNLPGRLPKVSPLSSPEYPSTVVLLPDSAGEIR